MEQEKKIAVPEAPRASHRALSVWAGLATLCAVAYVGLHSYPLQAGPADPGLVSLHSSAAIPGQLMFLLAVTSPIPLMISAFSGLRTDAGTRYWFSVLLLFLTPWLAFVIARQSAWPMTEAALARAAARAKPLILAIERHRLARGSPPAGLSELQLDPPNTGMRAYPTYQYRARSAKQSRTELWWYDLGPRAGRSLTGTWRSADGEVDHAILVARLDAVGELREIFADRMPIRPLAEPFSQELWRRSPEKRLNIVADLLDNHREALETSADLIALLGEPNSKRIEMDAPWELRVPSSPSDLEEPRFFYWPTRAYPRQIDGAPIERIGDWAYLVR